MPKLPFKGLPGAAHYRLKRGDAFTLRYRFPSEEKFRERCTEWRASRNERRVFFEWARKFLFSGGQIPSEWTPTAEVDSKELSKLDQSMTVAEAVRRYLDACVKGTKWMEPRAEETLSTQAKPVLGKFGACFGDATPLARITGDQIADFVRGLGGRRETKERHLCPISALYGWAIREGFLTGPNPAHGVVFWREKNEVPHDGIRKSYSDAEFSKLVAAAATDPLALDAIILSRYLALRPQDAVILRWEDWKWEQLLVAVRRMKTRESGVEVSHVDMHPVLAERYAHRRGATGFCLEYVRKTTKVVWPPRDELLARVEATSAAAVGRELGVSETAVRKRLLRKTTVDRITKRSVSEEQERRLLADSITQRVSRITRAADLDEPGIQPLYVLRHSFASDSLRRGVPPAIVAREMGISIATLEKYYWHAIPRGELDGRRTNRWGLSEASAPDGKAKEPARRSTRARSGAHRPTP